MPRYADRQRLTEKYNELSHRWLKLRKAGKPVPKMLELRLEVLRRKLGYIGG